MAFYLYLSKFFNPIQNLADQLNALQKALTASERIFNLLDVKPDVLDKPDAIKIDRFEGRIEFKNVWFAYKDDNWILKDVSFVIEPKQTCAFVGATGAGKTTILSLIVRNYEVQKGEILIDGININDIEISCMMTASRKRRSKMPAAMSAPTPSSNVFRINTKKRSSRRVKTSHRASGSYCPLPVRSSINRRY